MTTLEGELGKASKFLQEKINVVANIEQKLNDLQAEAAQAANELTSVQSKLNDEAFKFAKRTICRDDKVWLLACGTLFPFWCWQTRVVCHEERFITDAWNALNNTLPNLQQRATSKAIELNAKLNEKTIELNARATAEATKIALEGQIGLAKKETELALNAVDVAKKSVNELEDFVNNVLPQIPFPDIPKPGQWMPKSLTLVVNGSEYIDCEINQRLRRGCPSWTGFWETVSPEDQFVNGLRVVNMSESGDFDRLTTAFTGFFKVQDISGWEVAPVKKAKIVGTLKHAPSPGLDEFVSLDLQIESIKVNGKKYILDGNQSLRHLRFIRVEYHHRKNNGEDDERFKQWQVGQRFEVEGEILRDTDRATFYEIHPKKSGDIKQLR